MIEKNNTWILVDKPVEKKIIGVKWVFKLKLNGDGSVNKHKARFGVKGYSQEAGIDFFDTFALVARLDTIQLLLAITSQKGWVVYQMDVKSSFLNDHLNEDIFIYQLQGFEKVSEEGMMYRLQKALYGLRQPPEAWYNRLDCHLLSFRLIRSLNKATLYVKKSGSDLLVVSIYVDDILLKGSREAEVEEFKTKMKSIFEMSDLGKMAYFLEMEVQQEGFGVFIHQKKVDEELLVKFFMENCKSMCTSFVVGEKLIKVDGIPQINGSIYKSLIGSLLYSCATRPDITFSVNYLSRFMQTPTEKHFNGAKRVLHYIKGTTDYGILYGRATSVKLLSFSDSDWAGNDEQMKSISGNCFSMGTRIILGVQRSKALCLNQ